MVQRYEFDVSWGGYKDSSDARISEPNGRYVSYEDYAALEAERDELAARLRAVKDSLNHESNVETTDDFRICRSALLDLVTALDGPVPECRACAEGNATVSRLSALVIKSNPFVPVGELWVNSKWDEASHAAEGGGHE